MVGYSIVYLLEEKHSIGNGGISTIESKPGSEDIIIKIPVSVPYQTSQDKPEPAEGKIRHEGRFYQLISQQMVNDTLYLHAQFDQNARDQFMNLVSKINDQVTGNATDNQKQSHATVLKSFLKEYMTSNKKHTFYLLEWLTSTQYSAPFVAILVESELSIPSAPPNLS